MTGRSGDGGCDQFPIADGHKCAADEVFWDTWHSLWLLHWRQTNRSIFSGVDGMQARVILTLT